MVKRREGNMCKIYQDVFNKDYNISEATKVIPSGKKCYRTVKDKNGEVKTELCPFLDCLPVGDFHNEEDFYCKGFCHLLKRGDWFNKESGKNIDHITLTRMEKPVKVDSTQEPTEYLWDCVKNCHINEGE